MVDPESPAYLSVPFHLDTELGPNRVDVMLAMCFFSLDLTGEFTIAVSGTTFQVTDIDISSAPFELRFAEDFPVWVTSLHIECDLAAISPPGTLAARDGQIEVQSDVPIRVSMQVQIEGETERITFRTPFTLAGTISRSVMNLTGRFAFHLDSYSGDRMSTKLGMCYVMLNASSLIHCLLDTTDSANTIRLAFAGRTASLTVGGRFSVGLNGLDIRVNELALQASPWRFPGVLATEQIQISLDGSVAPVPVEFALWRDGIYHIRAAIPVRLRTQLAFEGFPPQPFEAPLLLKLEGNAALGAALGLSLRQQIEVAIGDGTISANIEGDLVARTVGLTEPRAEAMATQQRADETVADVSLSTRRAVTNARSCTARLVAINALDRRGGPAALTLMVSGLQDPAPEVRLAAVTALGRLGACDQAGALETAFKHDSDDRVRLAAMLALAFLEMPGWLDIAATAIRDPNETLRCQAALLLGRHARCSSADDLLVEALADDNPFVRLSAGMGLVAAGTQPAIHSIAALAYENTDVCVQMICAIALGQTQHEEARRALEHLLKSSEDVFVRRASLYARAKQESRAAVRDVSPNGL